MIEKAIKVICDVCGEEEVLDDDDYTNLNNLIIFEHGELCLCKDCISDIFNHLIQNHRLAVDLVIDKMKRGEL